MTVLVGRERKRERERGKNIKGFGKKIEHILFLEEFSMKAKSVE